MKVSAVEGYKLNNLNFEGKKIKEIQKPVHTSSPIKAIPVAVLIAMSPVNAPKTDAMPLSVTIASTPKLSRPQDFIESKNFKTSFNDIFVGLCKDKNSDNYRIWVDCTTSRLISKDQMNGFITEYDINDYKIEDTFGYKIQSFNFDNIYVQDANKKYQSGTLANKEACDYIYKLISNYDTDVKPKYHKYIMQLLESGNIEYKIEDNNKYQIAKENPMKFGQEIKSWEIETSSGKFLVKTYNTDGNSSDFETISVQDLRRQGPALKVKEIVATNNHIYNKADKILLLETYQINTTHNKAGSITIANKELWEFIYQLLSTKQCNDAAGARESHFYHHEINKQGIIEQGKQE